MTGAQSGSDRDKERKTGLAVGLVLGFLFLLTVAIVSIFMYRRYKSSKLASRGETVAFENPQYGPKITGLPGESTNEDHQFQYGHLHEEAETEHTYTTLDTPTMAAGGQSDSPATLSLHTQA